ncbi:ArsR family transcriptional regulator [Streptomyces sp. Wb2n-11]|uniref:ArsR family transcriptional regulator n=1 Tax=Streptomyces sp. Wb2n-11 TaxID=1030533 RepID=UPI000A90CCF2|nr:ArsR family transcriptional regulator [Streptomyces sp. Wb2n-11]
MAQDPGGTGIAGLTAPKASAQPRRRKILQHLSLHGSAAAAILARILGLNTGATSHHLREPARYGFYEETGGKSARRERCRRAVAGDRRSLAVQPLVYATVADAAGFLALVATALPAGWHSGAARWRCRWRQPSSEARL